MKQRALVSISLAFMLAFVATGAQFSLVTVSTAASNGGSDPIITLMPAVPDFSDPLNATLTQGQLVSQGHWYFDGSAHALHVPFTVSENSSGLHIGSQGQSNGWAGYFAQTPTSGINATTATVTMTAPSQLNGTGFFVTGLYIQTSDPSSLNYTSIGAVTSSAGTVWEVTQATGNETTATEMTTLWTDPATNQSTTMTCTLSTNGDNYLQVELGGVVVYENSSLSLEMPSPFLWFLEVQSNIPNKMNYGTFLNFTSTDLGFEPANVTVKAGSTVQWVVPVGYDTITSNSGNWSSPPLSSGESFNLTFNTSGVYGYHSVEHPWARGTITVLADPAIVVVRGTNNVLYYRTFNFSSNTWTGWTGLPGETGDAPAAAVGGDVLHIAVRSPDGNSLWYGRVNLTDGTFFGWTLLSNPSSGPTPSAPTLTTNSTTLALVIRGADDLIYYRLCDIATSTWTGWNALPSGTTPDTPAAALLGNTLHVVVRAMGNWGFWHSSLNLTNGAFSGWEFLDGSTTSMPVLTACASLNQVILVVRGTNDIVYVRTWTAGPGWAGWLSFPNGTSIDAVGATVIGTTLYIAVRSVGNFIWYNSMDLVAHTFSGWNLLDGYIPSAPAFGS